MKKVVVVVACLASFLVAKECKTMADLINGCIKTEYNYDKKPVRQTEWKNKKEVRVIYTKEYHNNGNLKNDCRGEGENKICKYYTYENGEFEIEYRGDKPYEGIYCNGGCVVLGEYKNGLKNGLWFELYPLQDQLFSDHNRDSILVEYVNGVMNGKARICRGYSLNRLLKERGMEEQFNELHCISNESGYYVNGKKNGMWSYSHPEYNVKSNGEFKDGNLIKFTYGNKEYEYEYEYIGDRENIDLQDMGYYIDKSNGNISDAQNVRFAKNCVETLLPDKEGNTNPNNKITGCFIGKDKKIRDGLTTISLEWDVGLFLKDIRVFTFEIYLDKGKIIKEKSKCQYDWMEFGDTTKLEEILNSGKKYTAKTYDSVLKAACW